MSQSQARPYQLIRALMALQTQHPESAELLGVAIEQVERSVTGNISISTEMQGLADRIRQNSAEEG